MFFLKFRLLITLSGQFSQRLHCTVSGKPLLDYCFGQYTMWQGRCLTLIYSSHSDVISNTGPN